MNIDEFADNYLIELKNAIVNQFLFVSISEKTIQQIRGSVINQLMRDFPHANHKKISDNIQISYSENEISISMFKEGYDELKNAIAEYVRSLG